MTSLNDIYKQSFPLKTKYVSERYFRNPWHTDSVKKLTDARKKYHGLLLENLATPAEYSSFRNKITSIIRKWKEIYYQRCFQRNLGNIKGTWKLIRNICYGHQDTSIEKLVSNGTTINNSADMAEIFNNFFTNIANDLADNLPHSTVSPYDYLPAYSNPPFVLDPVTPIECTNVINSLKNTKEHTDKISVSIFKKFHHNFVHILCEIINLSFLTGIFPKCFKHATVIPIFKKGDRNDVSNYRPIALLPFVGKIFERCIFTRLTNYAAAYNILSPNQFGFTKGKSTCDAIILLTEKIYECFNAGDGSFCLNIFVDFQKCFDCIDHIILINKLRLYGITGLPLDLIEDYLCDRTQSVRVRDSLSSTRSITKGVPQGSILGPLLFLFFINDLARLSNNFTPILFADDTTLSFKCQSIEEANILCNHELNNFFIWATSNKLSVNLGRTKTYIITHSFRNLNLTDLSINLNNHMLENFDHAKFLGVMIDRKLNYTEHIDFISNKISKSIGIIFKLSSLKIPSSVLKQLYHSFVSPYLNYCISCYGNTYPTHLNRLFLLQKRAIRLISKANFLDHTDPIFFNNGILKIFDLQ